MARCSGSGMRVSRSMSIAFSQACCRLIGSCSSSTSAIWLPMVSTGLSEVIGSWKIIAMSLPRTARIASVAEREQIDAGELDRAAGDAAGRIGHKSHQGERGDALAAAGFADDRQRLVRAQARS